MTGYVSWKDIQEEREREERTASVLVLLAEVVVVSAFLWILLASGCDAVDQTVKNDRKPEPVYTAQVHYFSQPAAFRLSTPTPEQMDKLHDLLTINQVRKADGTVPDGSDS